MRRWAWVSGLTLVLAYVMGAMLFGGDQALIGAYQVYLITLVAMAVLIPAQAIMPDHDAIMLTEWAVNLDKAERPIFPVFLAWGALSATCFFIVLMSEAFLSASDFWITISALTFLSIAIIVWSLRGAALQDLTLVPMAGLTVVIGLQAESTGVRWVYETNPDFYSSNPDLNVSVGFALAATFLLGLTGFLSALAAWRSLSKGNYPMIWALLAAVYVAMVAMVLEVVWAPSNVIGAYSWALHAAVMAAFMVFWAERFARADGPDDRLRMSFFVLSALACISFALVMILLSAALTVALAVTVVAAAALDRKFDLYPMTIFIAAGVVTLGYRLVADPGLGWATGSASIFELVLAYGGVLAAMIAGLWLLRGKVRQTATVMMDSAAWSVGGIFVSLILFRIIDASVGGQRP